RYFDRVVDLFTPMPNTFQMEERASQNDLLSRAVFDGVQYLISLGRHEEARQRYADRVVRIESRVTQWILEAAQGRSPVEFNDFEHVLQNTLRDRYTFAPMGWDLYSLWAIEC